MSTKILNKCSYILNHTKKCVPIKSIHSATGFLCWMCGGELDPNKIIDIASVGHKRVRPKADIIPMFGTKVALGKVEREA